MFKKPFVKGFLRGLLIIILVLIANVVLLSILNLNSQEFVVKIRFIEAVCWAILNSYLIVKNRLVWGFAIFGIIFHLYFFPILLGIIEDKKAKGH